MNEELGQDKMVSSYNDATLSIYRLHESWNKCKIFLTHGDLTRWKYELDAVFLELVPDILKTGNSGELMRENKRLMIAISKAKSRQAIFFALFNRHVFLRKVQMKAGKAGDYRSEDENLFD